MKLGVGGVVLPWITEEVFFVCPAGVGPTGGYFKDYIVSLCRYAESSKLECGDCNLFETLLVTFLSPFRLETDRHGDGF